MRYITYCLLLLFILSCDRESPDERFKRLCPYEFTLGSRHLFKIPFEIIPNQLTYKVGDTITVSSYFSKEVYDLSSGRNFKLDSLLLRPVIGITRFFGDEDWHLTNNENYILFDSIYTHDYGNSTFALFNNEEDHYKLEFKILLKHTGRYAMIIGDQNTNNEDQNNELLNSIFYSETCKNINVEVCNVIEGDNHMEELEPEFIFIDKELAFDNYKASGTSRGVYGSGSYVWEYNGAYGFIVED